VKGARASGPLMVIIMFMLLSPKGERNMIHERAGGPRPRHLNRASALSRIHAAAAASTRSARLARLMS